MKHPGKRGVRDQQQHGEGNERGETLGLLSPGRELGGRKYIERKNFVRRQLRRNRGPLLITTGRSVMGVDSGTVIRLMSTH